MITCREKVGGKKGHKNVPLAENSQAEISMFFQVFLANALSTANLFPAHLLGLNIEIEKKGWGWGGGLVRTRKRETSHAGMLSDPVFFCADFSNYG